MKHPYIITATLLLIPAFGWAASRDYSPPAEKKAYGVTFSQKFARDSLKIDNKAAYLSILDDLGVKKIRLMSYWDEMEPQSGAYNFADLDFMMDKAAERDAEINLVVGLRQPRWPECHYPAWAKEKPQSEQQKFLLQFIEQVAVRYKNHPALSAWQVENEPFLEFFGECPKLDVNFFKQEIELIKKLDNKHPIHVTASGEFTSWKKTAEYGDYLGVSLYRIVERKLMGKIYYPLFPAFYRWRGQLNKKFHNIYISELQAEPWTIGNLADEPIEKQFKKFSPAVFSDQIKFAWATGYETQYLWGVEWWYWLKSKGEDDFWNIAKKLFGEKEI